MHCTCVIMMRTLRQTASHGGDSCWLLVKSFTSNISGHVRAGTQLLSNMCSVCVCACLLVCKCICMYIYICVKGERETSTNTLLCSVVLRRLAPTWSGSCQQPCMWFWEETCLSTADSTPGCWVRNTHKHSTDLYRCTRVPTHHVSSDIS